MTGDDTSPTQAQADEAAPARAAPLALWRVAQAFLHTLHALFGGPERIAARHTLTADAHRTLAAWLRSAEAMLRRLLLIEAGAYPKPNTRPLLHSPRQRTRKLMIFASEAPETWRVSFRAFAAPRAQSAEHSPKRRARGPARFRSAWPLAERFEALIRVFNDPTASARRLARRLHAAPHRAVEVLRAPPEAEARVDRFEAFSAEAEAVWRARFSSA